MFRYLTAGESHGKGLTLILDGLPAGLAIDLASVWLGFGVITCNGSYIYSKSCGGVRGASATSLPVEELALALAIHCKLHNHPRRSVSRQDGHFIDDDWLVTAVR